MTLPKKAKREDKKVHYYKVLVLYVKLFNVTKLVISIHYKPLNNYIIKNKL